MVRACTSSRRCRRENTSLTVAAKGFTLYENDNVVIADQPLRLNVSMTIEVQTQKVQVSDTAPTVDVNPSNNAGAIVISGKELEALPDDPDELQSDLQALAGPPRAPTAGRCTSTVSPRANSRPSRRFARSALTRTRSLPSTTNWATAASKSLPSPEPINIHGQVFVLGNDSAFNSPNPFAGSEPPYYSTQFNGNIGGPLSKKASFFFNIDRRDINELAAVNAYVLDSSLNEYNLVESIANPHASEPTSARAWIGR